jgi:hypothetical protein
MIDPIQPHFHGVMNGVAEALDNIFNGDKRPKTTGFVLLAFEFGKTEGGRVNYISNADRADMIAAMKEWLARAEGRYAEPSDRIQ